MNSRRFILVSSILLIAIFSIFIASAETLVFSDNFSTNPNTNGKWDIQRGMDATNSNTGIFSSGQFQLTQSSDELGIVMFANYQLTSKKWRAEFDFKQDSGSDGIAFMFYKNKTYPLGVGHGFSLGMFSEPNTVSINYCTVGYGIAFDTHNNGNEGGNSAKNKVYFTVMGQGYDNFSYSSAFQENRVADNQWHHATILFDNGNTKLKIDNDASYIIDITQNIDYTNTGIGISASTGAGNGNKYIKNFSLYNLEAEPSAPNSVINLHLLNKTNTTLTWQWTNPTENFNGTIIFINNTNVANLTSSQNSYTAQNLAPNTTYTIKIHTIGLNGIINNTDVVNTASTLANSVPPIEIDTIPPGKVSNLNAIPALNSILLTWTNPADLDFNGTMIFVNDTLRATLDKTQTSYNIINLAENTTYNLAVVTMDLSGNLNPAFINATTLSSSPITPITPITPIIHHNKKTTHVISSIPEETLQPEIIRRGVTIGNLTTADLTSKKPSLNLSVLFWLLLFLILLILILIILLLLRRR